MFIHVALIELDLKDYAVMDANLRVRLASLKTQTANHNSYSHKYD